MCKMLVDNIKFKTMESAAKFLKIKPYVLWMTLADKDKAFINNRLVQRLGKKKQFVKMICLETNEVFNSKTTLANKLNIRASVISKSISDTGVFKYNNLTYKALDEKSKYTKEFVNRTVNKREEADSVEIRYDTETTNVEKEVINMLSNLSKEYIDEKNYVNAQEVLKIIMLLTEKIIKNN